LGLRAVVARPRTFETKADARCKLKIVSDLRGYWRRVSNVKCNWLRAAAVSYDRVTRIEANHGPAGWIELEHASQICGEVSLPGDPRIGNWESEPNQTGAGLVNEDVANAKKPRSRLRENTNPLETFAGLDSELPLNSASFSQELKYVFIWEEI